MKFYSKNMNFIALFLILITLKTSIFAQNILDSTNQVRPFVDGVNLLSVDCLMIKPISGGPQDCFKNRKVYQIQATQSTYSLLDKYTINSSYDAISKQCNSLMKNNTISIRYWCFNRKENWSIEFNYYNFSDPNALFIYLRTIQLKTCANSNPIDSLNIVARKFGKPSQVEADEEGMIYDRSNTERMTVRHHQTYPDAARRQTNDFGNESFSCPGNYYLQINLESTSFHSGLQRVIQKIQSEQSKNSSPKF